MSNKPENATRRKVLEGLTATALIPSAVGTGASLSVTNDNSSESTEEAILDLQAPDEVFPGDKAAITFGISNPTDETLSRHLTLEIGSKTVYTESLSLNSGESIIDFEHWDVPIRAGSGSEEITLSTQHESTSKVVPIKPPVHMKLYLPPTAPVIGEPSTFMIGVDNRLDQAIRRDIRVEANDRRIHTANFGLLNPGEALIETFEWTPKLEDFGKTTLVAYTIVEDARIAEVVEVNRPTRYQSQGQAP